MRVLGGEDKFVLSLRFPAAVGCNPGRKVRMDLWCAYPTHKLIFVFNNDSLNAILMVYNKILVQG